MKVVLDTIDGKEIWEVEDQIGVFFFRSGLAIDADGSPRAYHPDGSPPGLDRTSNAGRPGHWYGLVTNESGMPIVQTEDDPAPGFYVSPTALGNDRYLERDPRKYVNSERIPYFVLPGKRTQGARLGDLAMVLNERNGMKSGAVFADTGPTDEIGEGSIALAERLEVPSDPKHGGCGSGIVTVVFRHSRCGWPLTAEEIDHEAGKLFAEWGGIERLKALGVWNNG
jgi:hypothetical protein